MTPETHETLENLLNETRTFQPSLEFAAGANAQPFIYAHANRDRTAFWEEQAKSLEWTQPWNQVLDWQPPFAQWFVGGKINASVNCLDRHVREGLGDRIAFFFEGLRPVMNPALVYLDFALEGTTIVFTFSTCTP